MTAAFPFARSLLAFACFALLVAASAAHRKVRKSHNYHREHFNHDRLPNCALYSGGRITRDVVALHPIITPPYKSPHWINAIDHCKLKGRKLVGYMIQACDPFGPPGPSIKIYSKLTQEVKCYSDGPCLSGLVVKVSQYCSIY